MPKKIVSKKSVLKDMIELKQYDTYKFEIVQDYQESLNTDKGKLEANAAKHSIEENKKQLAFLKDLLAKI